MKTIAVGTDSSVPVNQLNIIATGGDAVITITTIVKINTILQPVIDKINDGKCYVITVIYIMYLTNLSSVRSPFILVKLGQHCEQRQNTLKRPGKRAEDRSSLRESLDFIQCSSRLGV